MEPKFLKLVKSLPKGAFMKLGVRRPMKMKAGQPQLFKVYNAVCKPGIVYDNISKVIENRLDGILPEENQGLLPSQSWVEFPYVIQSKDKFLYRFTRTGCHKPNVQYVDSKGNFFEKEIVKEMAYASEFKSGDTPVFNITEDYITSIQDVDASEVE